MNLQEKRFFNSIEEITLHSKSRAYRMVNAVLIKTYWKIGLTIVVDALGGNARAI